MFQLVITVMAIALSAFIFFAGMSYFNADTGVRLQTQQALQAQLEVIGGAISSYKSANNGFLPSSTISAVKGFIPGGEIPKLPQDDKFIWKLEKGNLCLERMDARSASRAVKSGTVLFAQNASIRRHPGSVRFAASCGSEGQEITKDTPASNIVDGQNIAIIFTLKG